MTTAELAKPDHPVQTFAEVQAIANVFMESRLFPDVKSVAAATVKIMAGAELGFGPFASMSGIHIIQGKAEPGANLIATLVKRSGGYDYRVLKITDDECSVEFSHRGKPVGVSTFTKADAARAGTQNMGKFPRNMLFARAISNGVKWFCPEVENGVTVYSPGEISDVAGDRREPEYVDAEPNQAAGCSGNVPAGSGAPDAAPGRRSLPPAEPAAQVDRAKLANAVIAAIGSATNVVEIRAAVNTLPKGYGDTKDEHYAMIKAVAKARVEAVARPARTLDQLREEIDQLVTELGLDAHALTMAEDHCGITDPLAMTDVQAAQLVTYLRNELKNAVPV